MLDRPVGSLGLIWPSGGLTGFRLVALGRLILAGAAICAPAPRVKAQSTADVPGVIVHRVPVPSPLQRLFGRAVYTASPSIVVLPGGDYLIASNIFGSGSGADVSGTTFLHRSSDRGATWEDVAILKDMKRGSLFVHNGTLYILGYTAAPGSIVIRASKDDGETWTVPADAETGLLREGRFGGTPCNPVVHAGRIWVAQGGRRLMSAPVDSDLLKAASWTLSRPAKIGSGPLGPGQVVTEAQVVASPRTGVVLMPKVRRKPYAVLIRAGGRPAEIHDPADEDWVQFPGGEKKFFVTYDSVSETFYALSNPVMPEDADKGWPPELVRNTAALMSSKDLRTWRTERIFLKSPNVDYEAFQYLNADIDGEDLVIASRTAFDVGGRRPPRGHDSNLITFHRIADFRSADGKPPSEVRGLPSQAEAPEGVATEGPPR
jgi:hypothetical protein